MAIPVPPFKGKITPVICAPPMVLPLMSLNVASVPEVGKVISVAPVVLKSNVDAPIVVKLPPVKTLPPNVIVLFALFIPVPPLEGESAVVKLKLPAVSEVPITPVPLILKLELVCCVVLLKI